MNAGSSAATNRAGSCRRPLRASPATGGCIEGGAQLSRRPAAQGALSFGPLDRRPKLIGIGARVQAVFDGARNRRDRYAVDRRDVGCLKVAAVEPVQLTPGRAGMVVARDGEMDARRVDVGKIVKRQGRLMRNNTTPQSPRHCGCEIVVLTARQHRHPVHTTTGTLKTSAGRQKTKLHGVHTDIPRVPSRDVAMLLGGKFNKLVPDHHVRNRIK